jgi:site-specific recombinase XerC
MELKRYLTEPEQQALLRAARDSSDPLAQRDYWWMRLMLATGARVTEFARITADQAEAALATGWLVVPAAQRKGGKRGHEYLLTQSVRDSLQALLALQQQRPAPIDGCAPAPLVWGRDGAALSVRSYQARMKNWARAAGLDLRASPHWLRHSRGVNVIRRSRSRNPLKVAQLALGHASISSTGVYTQMARDEYARDLQVIDGARMSRAAARALAQQGATR